MYSSQLFFLFCHPKNRARTEHGRALYMDQNLLLFPRIIEANITIRGFWGFTTYVLQMCLC